jgi:hypothetical protein
MTETLSNEQVRVAVERAFKPLRCVAEIWDYDQKLRFKVFDVNDKGIIEMPRLVLRELRDRDNLASVLSSAREHVEEKGFQLEPWTL